MINKQMEVEVDLGNVLDYLPVKRSYQLNDAFFEAGDRHLNGKQITFDEDLPEFLHKIVSEFCCQIAGCTARFTTLLDYEAHYGARHRHVCFQCKKSFPGSHLLDIHILETHDALFKILSEKQPMYGCLVEGCTDKFNDAAKRRNHVINIHKYPPDFRFVSVNKSKKVLENLMDVQETSTEIAATENASQLPFKYKPKIPKTICFGQGSSRSFNTVTIPSGNKNPKKNKQKSQKDGSWHRKSNSEIDMDTSVNIEEVVFDDMLDTLP